MSSPTAAQYSDGSHVGVPSSPPPGHGELPMTGFGLIALVFVAAVLIGLGAAARR